MQTTLQAGLLAPGSSYSPAFPNRGSVALLAFVPVTAAGPLPVRAYRAGPHGIPYYALRHPEVPVFISSPLIRVNFYVARALFLSTTPHRGLSLAYGSEKDPLH